MLQRKVKQGKRDKKCLGVRAILYMVARESPTEK
jgi:hypothetical protein